MTTWLPAACIGIVILCTVIGMLEPMFNSNSHNVRGGDRLLGAIIGLVIGLIIAGMFYTAVWLVGYSHENLQLEPRPPACTGPHTG